MRLGITVHGGRLEIRGVLEQALEDVDRFPHPAWDEMAEQRHVSVSDVVVGDATVTAVSDRVLGQETIVLSPDASTDNAAAALADAVRWTLC